MCRQYIAGNHRSSIGQVSVVYTTLLQGTRPCRLLVLDWDLPSSRIHVQDTGRLILGGHYRTISPGRVAADIGGVGRQTIGTLSRDDDDVDENET